MTDTQLRLLDHGLRMIHEGEAFKPETMEEPVRDVFASNFLERGVVGWPYMGRKIVVAAIARMGYFEELAC
jgi:hypothetical protein